LNNAVHVNIERNEGSVDGRKEEKSIMISTLSNTKDSPSVSPLFPSEIPLMTSKLDIAIIAIEGKRSKSQKKRDKLKKKKINDKFLNSQECTPRDSIDDDFSPTVFIPLDTQEAAEAELNALCETEFPEIHLTSANIISTNPTINTTQTSSNPFEYPGTRVKSDIRYDAITAQSITDQLIITTINNASELSRQLIDNANAIAGKSDVVNLTNSTDIPEKIVSTEKNEKYESKSQLYMSHIIPGVKNEETQVRRNTYMYIYMYMCASMYLCIYKKLYFCAYIFIHTYIYRHLFTYVYTFIYLCIYI
jgi:hypothetical protein